MSAFPIGGAIAAVLSGLLLPNWRLMFLLTLGLPRLDHRPAIGPATAPLDQPAM